MLRRSRPWARILNLEKAFRSFHLGAYNRCLEAPTGAHQQEASLKSTQGKVYVTVHGPHSLEARWQSLSLCILMHTCEAAWEAFAHGSDHHTGMVPQFSAHLQGQSRYDCMTDLRSPICYKNLDRCGHVLFTSEPLEEPLEVTGWAEVSLWVSSCDQDVDLFCYLESWDPSSEEAVWAAYLLRGSPPIFSYHCSSQPGSRYLPSSRDMWRYYLPKLCVLAN